MIKLKSNKKLQVAVKNGNVDYVMNAIKYDGEDASMYDSALLCVGVVKSNLAIIKALVENGANPNARKSLALRAALVYDKMDIAKYLVTVGADINSVINTPKGLILSELLAKNPSTVGVDFSLTGQINLRDSLPIEVLDFDITSDVKDVVIKKELSSDISDELPTFEKPVEKPNKLDFDFDTTLAMKSVESTQILKGNFKKPVLMTESDLENIADRLDFDITGGISNKANFSKTENKMKNADFDFDITDMGYTPSDEKESKEKTKPVSTVKDDFPDIDLSMM